MQPSLQKIWQVSKWKNFLQQTMCALCLLCYPDVAAHFHHSAAAPPECQRLVWLWLQVRQCRFSVYVHVHILQLNLVSRAAAPELFCTCTGSTPCTWSAVCPCSPAAVGQRGSALSQVLPPWTCHEAPLRRKTSRKKNFMMRKNTLKNKKLYVYSKYCSTLGEEIHSGSISPNIEVFWKTPS